MRPKTAKPKMEGNFAYAQNFTDKLASVDRGTTQTQKLLIFGRRPKSARANLSPGARCGDFRSADSNFSKSSFDNTSLAAGLRKSSDKFQQNSPSRTLFHCTDPQIKDKELPARSLNELEGIWSLEPCFEDVKEPNHGNGSHVEIYPASATMNPLPPKAPFLQDPSPRRRFVQPQIELLGANARPFVSRTEVLKELQPALRSISKLCTESHLGKLAMQVQDIVLVLTKSDICTLSLFDSSRETLQTVPGTDMDLEQVFSEPPSLARGVIGLAAKSAACLRVDDLFACPHFDADCDLRVKPLRDQASSYPVRFVAAPATGPSGVVVGVISAQRSSRDALPFSAEDEAMLTIVAQHAGVAIASFVEQRELRASRHQARLISEAAVRLCSDDGPKDLGQLAHQTSAYARALCACDDACLYLSNADGIILRTWEAASGSSAAQNTARNPRVVAPSGVHCLKAQECLKVQEIRVPGFLKAVLSSGAVVNVLAPISSGLDWPACGMPVASETRHGQGTGMSASITTIVKGVDGARVPVNSTNLLAVPLQTERGAPVLGFIKAVNRQGRLVFSPRDEESLRNLAHIAAAAVLREERARRMAEFVAGLPAASALTNEVAAAAALEDLVQAATDSDMAFAFMVDQDTGGFVCFTAARSNRSLSGTFRLPSTTYPLSAAAVSRKVHDAVLRDVPNQILARGPYQAEALMRSASALSACAIRGASGLLLGVMLVATTRDPAPFAPLGRGLLESLCAIAGAALAGSSSLQRKKELQIGSGVAAEELLGIASEREIEPLMLRVAAWGREFLSCSRAVLYLVDQSRGVVWTVLESGGLAAAELRADAALDTGPARSGFAVIAACQGTSVEVREFAHGHRAYNDLVDSADLEHVGRVSRLQPGRIDVTSVAAGRAGGYDDEYAVPEPQEATESVAAHPVFGRGAGAQVVAVVQVMNRRSGGTGGGGLHRSGFDKGDMERLALLCESVAAALETCAVLRRRWKTEVELRSLVESSGQARSVCVEACARASLDDAMSFAARSCAAECGATQVAVFLAARDEDDAMDVVRFEGGLFLPSKPVRVPVVGLAGRALRNRELLNVVDCRTNSEFEPLVDGKKFVPVASMLACPILNPAGDAVLAVLVLQNKRRARCPQSDPADESTDPLEALGKHLERRRAALAGHSEEGWSSFVEKDETFVTAVAEGLAVAMARHELLDQLSAVTQRAMELSREIEEPDKLLSRVADACSRLCCAECCLIFLLDNEDDNDRTGQRQMRTVATGGPELVVPSDLGIAGAVMRTGTIVNVPSREKMREFIDKANSAAALEAAAKPASKMSGAADITVTSIAKYAALLRGLRSGLGIPLLLQDGRVTGVLELGNKRGRNGGFTAADERALLLFAGHARAMLEHSVAHAAAAARLRAQRSTLRCVSDLTQQVASAFARTGSRVEAYGRMVRAACEVLGAARGGIHLIAPGAGRRIVSYDANGRQIAAAVRPGASIASVLELGIMVNTTAVANSQARNVASRIAEHGDCLIVAKNPLTTFTANDTRYVQQLEQDSAKCAGCEDSPSSQSCVEDRRLLCAPITNSGFGSPKGDSDTSGRRAVVGVLEVELGIGEEGRIWREEDEEALMHLAEVVGSLIEVMPQMRTSHPAHPAQAAGRRRSVVAVDFPVL